MQNRTDGELLKAYVAGEQGAFSQIVGRYTRPLLRFVDSMVHDQAKSEDIVQETFFRLHQLLQQQGVLDKLSSWLFSVASNLALDELKCSRRRKVSVFSSIGPSDPEFEDSRPGPDKDLDNRVLAELISGTFAKMHEPYRRTLVLREVNQMNYKEIAEITGVSLIAVKMRIMRGREMFADLIQPALR